MPQESYIVSEGKKRGSTRDVRPEAAHDRFYTVLRVHAGDAHRHRQLAHQRSARPRPRELRGLHVRDADARGVGRDDRKRSPRLLHRRRPRLGAGSRAGGGQEEGCRIAEAGIPRRRLRRGASCSSTTRQRSRSCCLSRCAIAASSVFASGFTDRQRLIDDSAPTRWSSIARSTR